MTRGSHLRLATLLSALLVLAAVVPAEAAADISVPGWRSFAATGKIEVEPEGGPAPNIQLVSRRRAKAGIDQVIVNPPRTLALLVIGSVLSGEGRLQLDWLDVDGEEIETEERTLELDQGRELERFTAPEGSESTRIALLQDSADSVLELDSVELVGPGGVELLNPELRPSGCPTDNTVPVSRYGAARIPAWPSLLEDTTFEVLRWRGGRSPPVRVTTPNSHTGIAQFVAAPAAPVTVVIRGFGASPGAYAVTAWRRPAIRTTPDQGLLLVEEERRLDLSQGEQSFVTEPPAVGDPLVLQVSVVEDERGSLALQSITTDSRGAELLENPDLTVSLCPIAPQSPPAAGAVPPIYRWPLTGALLLVGLGLLVGIWRAPGEAVTPGPLPSRWLRIAFFVAVALTPFVIVGSAKVGLRVIVADWIFLGLAILLLLATRYRAAALSDRARVVAIFSIALLAILTGISLVVSQVYSTDENLAGLSVADKLVENIGSPQERGIVDQFHLLQGLAALFATLALVSTRAMWVSTVRVVALTGAAVGVYGLYQVGSQWLLGTVVQPPGAFPPEGLRAAGPFPEPTAYAGFLVFAASCAVALIELGESRRIALASLSLILAGAFVSRSSIGLAALLVLIAVLVLTLRLRTLAWMLLPAVVLVVAAAVAPGERWKEPLTKPLGISNSVLDREVVWSAALQMGETYAPVGVGRGQFAYNQAPFVHPDDADRGGRASSGILELWAESGPLGVLFFAAAVMAGPLLLLTRRGPPGGSSRTARAIVAVMAVTLIAVMAMYYTTNYAWIWLAVGLLAAAPRALAEPAGGDSREPAALAEQDLTEAATDPEPLEVDR